MKILYLLQTHKQPEQIYRLVQTIKKSSFNSHILLSHDFTNCSLDVSALQSLPGVNILGKEAHGVRGDFSLVQAYLDAINWVLEHNIDFDWLVNLSGQDYPTQSLTLFEQFLAKTEFDGFLEYSNLLSRHSYYGIKESYDRYFYQYWHSGLQLYRWQRGLVKPLRVVFNNTQPFIKIDSSYQLSMGLYAFINPFNQDFICYGGSFFKIISQNCVQYLNLFLKANAKLIKYYERTRNPDESLIQSVLVNNKSFKFCKQNKFYIDWTGTRHGHPRVLTVKDYSALTTNDVFFARKFDIAEDNKILDMLDARIFQKNYVK